MNEETKVFDENTIEEVAEEAVELIEESNGGFLGLAIVAMAAVGSGVAAWLYNKSGKLDERRARILEKKGYTVTRPEPVEDVEVVELHDEDAE